MPQALRQIDFKMPSIDEERSFINIECSGFMLAPNGVTPVLVSINDAGFCFLSPGTWVSLGQGSHRIIFKRLPSISLEGVEIRCTLILGVDGAAMDTHDPLAWYRALPPKSHSEHLPVKASATKYSHYVLTGGPYDMIARFDEDIYILLDNYEHVDDDHIVEWELNESNPNIWLATPVWSIRYRQDAGATDKALVCFFRNYHYRQLIM